MRTRIGHAYGRRLLSLLLALVICFGAIGLGTLTASAANRTGDTDGDGNVTARDARFVLRLSARLETATAAQKAAADVDGDGKVTAKDARIILRVSARLTSFEKAVEENEIAKMLADMGKEANAFRSCNGYFAGYVYNENDEGQPLSIALRGNDYSIDGVVDGILFRIVCIDGSLYILRPSTKQYAELTDELMNTIGLTREDLVLPFVPQSNPESLADIEAFTVEDEGVEYLCTMISNPEKTAAVCYYTIGDKLDEIDVIDLETEEVVSWMTFTTVSDVVPRDYLSLDGYHASEFTDMFADILIYL